jgi:hypothetical protein
MSKVIAWADDAAFNGSIGNVSSDAAKRYWEKSDWVDRKRAELLIHPLYAQQPAQPDCRTCQRQSYCYNLPNLVKCINGNEYKPSERVVLWRTE